MGATRGSKMHSLLIASTTFTGSAGDLIAQGGIGNIWAMIASIWGTAWPYLMMLGGFSVIVFIHELGHFAVAKWAGVRVDRFAVGFGREIFGFTKGETRYSFNILPLGGYVKMLGQEDFDDKSEELKYKDDPGSFPNKPIGHRMAIVSAGVVMNLLFACFIFMIVFWVGMDAAPPRVGIVVSDSPAEQVGILPGDLIKEINGERILEFQEVMYAILLAEPHEPIEILVERDGELLPPFYITPKYRDPASNADIKRQRIGIAAGVTREILAVGSQIDPDRPDHPHVGDILVEVDGREVTKENASMMLANLVYAKGDIYVERPDPKNPDAPPTRVLVQVPPRLEIHPADGKDPRTIGVLGLTPMAKFAFINPAGRAFLGGIKEGDIILNWEDKQFPSRADISQSVRDNAERDIFYRVRRADGSMAKGFVRPKTIRNGPATIQSLILQGEDGNAVVETVRAGGVAAKAGIEAGDVILRMGDMDKPSADVVRKEIRSRPGSRIPMSVRKASGRVAKVIVTPQKSGTIGASYRLVADDLLRVGAIVERVDGQLTPAAKANIPAGALITSVDDQEVSKWRELIDAFREKAGTTVQLAYQDVAGESHVASFDVPPSIRTVLGLGPESRILSIAGKEAVDVTEGGETRTLPVGYRKGTRVALEQVAGQKGVTIEYRTNRFAPRQVAQIDVTPDMVDPWVSRIAYGPSVVTAPSEFLLKGEGMLDAVGIGAHKTYYMILQVYTMLERMIFTRNLGLESMSGPLGIFDIGSKVAKHDFIKFLFFLGMLSANLAVINFLPLPIVDGGLMIFLIIEKIKGSPVSLRVQVATQMIGLFLILGIFLFVTYQDVLRKWG
jgi:membrane-associated protease RseP (regulator of RpoE activity)